MKLGFYVDTNGGTPRNSEIYNFLNQEVENNTLEDAAVFFDTVDFNPIQTKFGMFDATELWHFTGHLITTSIIGTVKAESVVNKFKVAYLFNAADKNERTIFELIRIANNHKVLVTNELDEKEFLRLTGVKPTLMEGFSLQQIREVFDE
jgi:hypothetical protein